MIRLSWKRSSQPARYSQCGCVRSLPRRKTTPDPWRAATIFSLDAQQTSPRCAEAGPSLSARVGSSLDVNAVRPKCDISAADQAAQERALNGEMESVSSWEMDTSAPHSEVACASTHTAEKDAGHAAEMRQVQASLVALRRANQEGTAQVRREARQKSKRVRSRPSQLGTTPRLFCGQSPVSSRVSSTHSAATLTGRRWSCGLSVSAARVRHEEPSMTASPRRPQPVKKARKLCAQYTLSASSLAELISNDTFTFDFC